MFAAPKIGAVGAVAVDVAVGGIVEAAAGAAAAAPKMKPLEVAPIVALEVDGPNWNRDCFASALSDAGAEAVTADAALVVAPVPVSATFVVVAGAT